MIVIKPSVISHSRGADATGFIRLSSDLIIDGKPFTLYVETEEQWGDQWFVTERADPFLVGVLFYAMKNNHDIICESPVTSELLYNLETQLIPTLSRHDADAHRVKITADHIDTPLENAGAVGTGVSMGLDCFHTLATQLDSPYQNLRLTHLLSFSSGTFGGYYHKTGWSYAQAILSAHQQELSREVGLPIIKLSSNLPSLVKDRLDQYATYMMALMVMSLGKLFGTYFYSSSGWDYSTFTVVPNSKFFDCAHYDLLTLNSISFRGGTRFYSEGGEKDRVGKFERIMDYPLAQEYLQSCLTESFNCGVCAKCRRNLLTLDAIGGKEALAKFARVYDIPFYWEHRDEHLIWMCEQITLGTHTGNFYLKDLWERIKRREPTTMVAIEAQMVPEEVYLQRARFRQSRDILRRNSRLFRVLAQDQGSLTKIKEFFSSRGYKNVILYGNTAYTTFFYEVRQAIDISIDYVVEDAKGKRHLPRLPESTVDYPDTDAIIICGYTNPELIKRKLTQRCRVPIHYATEVLDITQKEPPQPSDAVQIAAKGLEESESAHDEPAPDPSVESDNSTPSSVDLPAAEALPLSDEAPIQFHYSSRPGGLDLSPECWSQSITDQGTRLTPKAGFAKRGVQATMPLRIPLEKGKKHRLFIELDLKTRSREINFHIKNSKTGTHQVILSCAVSSNGVQTFAVQGEFTPLEEGYDQFMIGATHIRGAGSYLLIKSVTIETV